MSIELQHGRFALLPTRRHFQPLKRVCLYAILIPNDCTFTRKESASFWLVFRSRNSLFWGQNSRRYEIWLAGRKNRNCASAQVPMTKGIESEATSFYGIFLRCPYLHWTFPYFYIRRTWVPKKKLHISRS